MAMSDGGLMPVQCGCICCAVFELFFIGGVMTKEDLIYEILGLWEDSEKVLVSPARMDFYRRNLDKVLELEMEERLACILKKRYFEGCTFKKSGQSIVKVQGYVKTPCEGVTTERARQMISKAVRMLKHPSRRRMLKGLKTL